VNTIHHTTAFDLRTSTYFLSTFIHFLSTHTIVEKAAKIWALVPEREVQLWPIP